MISPYNLLKKFSDFLPEQCTNDNGFFSCFDAIFPVRNLRDDTINSIVVGLLIGVLLIVTLAAYPGNPCKTAEFLKIRKEEHVETLSTKMPKDGEHSDLRRRHSQKARTRLDSDAKQVITRQSKSDKTRVNRESKAARLLGISENEVVRATLEAKLSLHDDDVNDRTESRKHISITRIADIFVYSCFIGGLLYCMTGGDSSNLRKFLIKVFPKEMAALGFK